MPRACSVCVHPDRNEIDSRLLEIAGTPGMLRTVTDKYGLSRQACLRHQEHIPTQMAKAEELREVAATEYGGTLLDRLKHLSGEMLAVIKEARDTGGTPFDPHAHNQIVLKAVARLEKHLELEAKLLGELKDAGVNITINQGADAAMLARLIDAGLCPACRGKIVDMERAVTGEWRTE